MEDKVIPEERKRNQSCRGKKHRNRPNGHKPLERLEIFPELPDEFLEKFKTLKKNLKGFSRAHRALVAVFAIKKKRARENKSQR